MKPETKNKIFMILGYLMWAIAGAAALMIGDESIWLLWISISGVAIMDSVTTLEHKRRYHDN